MRLTACDGRNLCVAEGRTRLMPAAAALRIDPPDDLLDVRLGDLQVDEPRLGRDTRGQLGGGAAEAQPLPWAVDALDASAVDLERRRRLLQVDDQRALGAVALLQVGDLSVPDEAAMVAHEETVAQPLGG